MLLAKDALKQSQVNEQVLHLMLLEDTKKSVFDEINRSSGMGQYYTIVNVHSTVKDEISTLLMILGYAVKVYQYGFRYDIEIRWDEK